MSNREEIHKKLFSSPLIAEPIVASPEFAVTKV